MVFVFTRLILELKTKAEIKKINMKLPILMSMSFIMLNCNTDQMINLNNCFDTCDPCGSGIMLTPYNRDSRLNNKSLSGFRYYIDAVITLMVEVCFKGAVTFHDTVLNM